MVCSLDIILRCWLTCLVIGYASTYCTFDDSILDGPECPIVYRDGADYSACQNNWFTFKEEKGKVQVRYRLKGKGVNDVVRGNIDDVMKRFNKIIPCLNIKEVGIKDWFKGKNSEILTIEVGKECYTGLEGIGGSTSPARVVEMSMTLCSHHEYWNIWNAVFVHEMFHVFSFAHTHRRIDRDQHVVVNTNNILSYKLSQYEICTDCTIYGDYECNSIMHYTGNEFAIDRKLPTMVPLGNSPTCRTLGNLHPTANDWEQLAIKLGCKARSHKFPKEKHPKGKHGKKSSP